MNNGKEKKQEKSKKTCWPKNATSTASEKAA